MNDLTRWMFAARTLPSYAARLNRCVEVEQLLLDVANGKRDVFTREECRTLAFKLAGVAKLERK